MTGGGNHRTQRAHVERIVRELLAEVLRTSPEESSSKGELRVAAKVVSARELEGRLGGIERLIVSRGAVITPAARDLLKERNIAVASAVEQRTTSAGRRLVLGVAETNPEVTRLLQLLSGEGVNVERLPQNNLIEAVDSVCQRVAGGTMLGLVLTGRTAAALSLANRHVAVRAAWAASTTAVKDAMNSLAANVLIVDPVGKTTFEWKRLLAPWLHAGPIDCPAALRERLG